MDIYTINGVQVEYDTLDLVNMEVYDGEVRRIADEANKLKNTPITEDNYLSVLREQCVGIMDAFDCIIGEGTSEKLFGGKCNIETILDSYGEFTKAVAQRVANMRKTPMNRQQRRANERQQRREEAAKRVAARQEANEN